VYIDDLIGLDKAQNALLYFTPAILHSIYKVFLPPRPTDDQIVEPISVKKLKQGNGLWSTKKKILGLVV